ncbi:unnamed protein product [Dovyalis caffra]|uniref:Flavonoid 3'-hydroxylase n=1 Tax=Dovyalis caffra TaxID=77055 RepID=A0AAV1RXA7_9ROSI|nr:unnamed protein product [Dovyalis caffra]
MSPLILYSGLLAIFVYCLLHLRSLLNRHPHPLPPGPKPWPLVGNLLQLGPMPHQSMAALAKTYGPLMHLRFGFVDVVVAASASVAAQFLKVHDANFSSRPPNSGAKHIAYNYQDLVFAPYGPRWRVLRKISSVHLFSAKSLDDFRHVRQDEVALLTRALASAGATPVNLGQLLNVCTANALGRVMLGRRVFGDGSGGGDPKADEFKSMVVEVMVLAGVFNIGDFVPALEWLDLQGVAAKMKKLHKRFDAFLTNIVEEHKIKSTTADVRSGKHTDLLSTLIGLKDEQQDVDGEGGKLTDTEIKALLLNMFTAGTDTSSSTVEWAIAELIRHPNILAQVQQELDSVVGGSSSTVLVNVWAIARDPDLWTEPLEFRPERFLPGGEKADVDVKGSDFELIPFGAGRRICAGMSLGLRMVQLLTATLIHAFDWELANGLVPEKLDMQEAYGLTLQRAVPLMVHPRRRLSPNLYKASN